MRQMREMVIRAVLACACVVAVAGTASAGSITGNVTFAGAFKTDTGDFQNATSLNFTGGTVLTGSGTYNDVPFLTPVAFKDFTFSPFMPPIVDLWKFTASGVQYSFDLESLNVLTRNNSVLELSGAGTLSAGGHEDTAGTWYLLAANTFLKVDFFAAKSAGGGGPVSVPESGTTAALFALGVLAIGAMRRSVVA